MKKIILALLLLLINLWVVAQTNNELKGLINSSFAYFNKIKEIENTINIATEKVALIQLSNDPVVNASSNVGFTGPVPQFELPLPSGTRTIQFQPRVSYGASIGASYNLYDFGKLKATVDRAKIDITAAQHNVTAAKQQVANQVSIVYYSIIYYQKAMVIEDSIIVFLKKNKQIVEAKFANGDGLKLDVLTIQAAIDNEENKKLDIQSMLQKQQNVLAYISGTSAVMQTAFDFDTKNVDTSIAFIEKNNIEFALLNDKINQTNADIATIKLQDKPSLLATGATGIRNGIAPNIANPRFNYIGGVTLTLPIYNGGKVKQQIKIQQQLLQQTNLAYNSLTTAYQKDVQQSLVDIATNIQRIENLKSQIELTKYAQTIASTRFVNGIGSNIELLNAATNTQRAAYSNLQYQYQLCLAQLELARLQGIQYW